MSCGNRVSPEVSPVHPFEQDEEQASAACTHFVLPASEGLLSEVQRVTL